MGNEINTNYNNKLFQTSKRHSFTSLPKIDKAIEILIEYNKTIDGTKFAESTNIIKLSKKVSNELRTLKKANLEFNNFQKKNMFMQALLVAKTLAKKSMKEVSLKSKELLNSEPSKSLIKHTAPLFSPILYVGSKVQELSLSRRLISLLSRIAPSKKKCLISFKKQKPDQLFQIKKDLKQIKDFFSKKEDFESIMKTCRENIDNLNVMRFLGDTNQTNNDIQKDLTELQQINAELSDALLFYSKVNVDDINDLNSLFKVLEIK